MWKDRQRLIVVLSLGGALAGAAMGCGDSKAVAPVGQEIREKEARGVPQVVTKKRGAPPKAVEPRYDLLGEGKKKVSRD